METSQRFAIGIEYDGSRFCGWQSQKSRCSVQDHLEDALTRIAGKGVRVYGAGRTDAGVHAIGQVAHFDSLAKRQPSAWVRGVNSLLPDSAAVRWARPVPPEFHARHSAHWRRYRYVLLNRAQRPGIYSAYVGWHHVPLDTELMRIGAALLVGAKDFSAFQAASCQSRTAERNLIEASVDRSGDVVTFEFAANAFLHHMVRNMVAALVYVGRGKHPPEWIGELLESRSRTGGAPTFVAEGLYLSGVEYNRSFGLPSGGSDLTILPFPK